MDLPTDLRIALDNELAAIPRKTLVDAAARLSLHYRDNNSHGTGIYLHPPTDV